MTQKEFEALVGYEVSPNEYELIEKVYYLLDTDKQDFCIMWKSASQEARNSMEAMALKVENSYAKKQHLIDKLVYDKNHLAEEVFEAVHRTSDLKLREVCINYFGRAGYIRMMLSRGYNLWEDDKTMLLKLLSEGQ